MHPRSPEIQAFSLCRPGLLDRPATPSKIPACTRIHFPKSTRVDERPAKGAREKKTGCSTNGKQTVLRCRVEGRNPKRREFTLLIAHAAHLLGTWILDLSNDPVDPRFTVTHSRSPAIHSRARLIPFPRSLKRTPPADSSRRLFDRCASAIIVRNFFQSPRLNGATRRRGWNRLVSPEIGRNLDFFSRKVVSLLRRIRARNHHE